MRLHEVKVEDAPRLQGCSARRVSQCLRRRRHRIHRWIELCRSHLRPACYRLRPTATEVASVFMRARSNDRRRRSASRWRRACGAPACSDAREFIDYLLNTGLALWPHLARNTGPRRHAPAPPPSSTNHRENGEAEFVWQIKSAYVFQDFQDGRRVGDQIRHISPRLLNSTALIFRDRALASAGSASKAGV